MTRTPATKITPGPNGAPKVWFGWMEAGEFVLSHANPPRVYSTTKGAERAQSRWIAEQNARDAS